MIVSHEHRFIFIHCRKVAGSAMKVALSPHLGPRDIVVGSLNEIVAAGQPVPNGLNGILRNVKTRTVTLGAYFAGKSWPEAQNIAVKRHFASALGPNSPHPPASVAAAFLGSNWDRYFKFCFTRNPFERIASDYNWRSRVVRRDFSFDDFVTALEGRAPSRGLVHSNGVTNWDMMTIDGRLVVDRVGRYEHLERDFGEILATIGLPETSLGGEKTTATHRRNSYAKLYTKDLRKRVESLCKPELDAFDYVFPY